MWVNSQTLVVYDYIYEIRQAFPETSFPEYPTDADFETVGVYPLVVTPKPEYDPITQTCTMGVPELVEDIWCTTWVITQATQQEIIFRQQQARMANKNEATTLLQQTDWTATVDINNPQYSNPYLGNQPEFLVYRSQVRQIAINPPVTVDVWPTPPEEVWVDVSTA